MQGPEVPGNGKKIRTPPAMLIIGESAQGFLTAKPLPPLPQIDEKVESGSFTRTRLEELL